MRKTSQQKFFFFTLTFISFVSIFLFSKIAVSTALAVGCGGNCTTTADCDSPNGITTVTCTHTNGTVYTVGPGHCSCTTSSSAYCPPASWTNWSACTADGYQIRWCNGNSTDTQVRTCATPPPPPGGPGPTTPPSSCTTGAWTNGTCGGGACGTTERQQTRTVSPAGCAVTSRCVVDNSCSTVTCTTGAWTNGVCGGGACGTTERQQTRTVSPAGCAATSQCIVDNSCVTSCVAGSWVNGTCGGGSCTSGQRLQTRTTTPANCTTTSRCVTDNTCTITPPPPPGCTTGTWANATCGGGACTTDQMQQTRTVSPAGCAPVSRCVANASCTSVTCTTGAWANVSCGGGTCTADQMQQRRSVSPAGCAAATRCVASSTCGPPPPPACTTGAWSNVACGGGTCGPTQMQQRRTVTPAGCTTATRCVASAGCVTPPPTPPPSCTLTLSPSTLNLILGGATGTITATANCNVTIDEVRFTSSNTTVATVSPGTDTNSPYRTTVTAVGPGATTITGRVYAGGTGVALASDTTTVNSTPPQAWWRVRDADVGTGGDLTSALPSGENFDENGAGGYPGVPYFGGSSNLTNGNVSTRGWLVANNGISPRVYDYQALVAQLPSDITSNFNNLNAGDNVASRLTGSANADSDGYYWFRYNGAANGGQTLNLGAVNIGSRKVILLVSGANLNITGNVTLNNGSGFFMTAVDGNINVASGVGGGTAANPNLEGIYEADGNFSDGSGSTALYIRGSVVAYGGVNMQRDLVAGNVTTPAEMFEFAPDQILLYPSKLGTRRINWKEVAP